MPYKMPPEVIDTIRGYLRDSGLNQKQLAQMIGISKSTISKWLSAEGEVGVDSRIWLEIEKVLHDRLPAQYRIEAPHNSGIVNAPGRDMNGNITQNNGGGIDAFRVRLIDRLLCSDLDKDTIRRVSEIVREVAESPTP